MKTKGLVKAIIIGLMSIAIASCGGDNSTPSNSTSVSESPSVSESVSDLVSPPTYEEESFQLHYYRADRAFSTWALWLWAVGGEGAEYSFNGVDEYGAVASYPLSTFGFDPENFQLGFIVKSAGSWTSKDPDGDRFVVFSSFTKDENDIYHVYLKSGDANIYATKDWIILDSINSAKFSSTLEIAVACSNKISSYIIYEDGEVFGSKTLSTPAKTFIYVLQKGQTAKYTSAYTVEVTFLLTQAKLNKQVSIRTLFATQDFADAYTYDGNDLGATYTSSATTFKVWSPISSSVVLNIYSSGTPTSVDATNGSDITSVSEEMTLGEKGVWTYVAQGDFASKYYTYTVTNSTYPSGKEIVDPYAKSAGINGLRGQIVDFNAIDQEVSGWNEFSPLQIDRKALTVYETHIADITSSATWTTDEANLAKAKTYEGARISGTTFTKGQVTVKTGFDHIKELGVNAVQLIPIFDQANNETKQTFNWGYNPLNYNVLEGSYSSNPYDGYTRIKEFKELVRDYNKAGINIIMDVVYNHFSGLSGSNFDVLLPGYYFRYNSSGEASNGSGCGNETASEMPMFRKFMIESASFWSKEYKLGGFRFDLMGLHDLETMDALTTSLKNINPSICVYGEPWTGGTSALDSSLSAKQANGYKYNGYGAFNDQMRDGLIKGGLNAITAKGWVTDKEVATASNVLSIISSGIKGITKLTYNSMNDPDTVTNYVTCHDNYTLYDRIFASGEKDPATIKKMATLANSMVFTSQGTSFMLAGEEFYRTKGGNSNSYDAGYQVNELDYSLKVDNLTNFANYQKLIDLKKNIDGLHLDKDHNGLLSVSATSNQIKYQIADTIGGKNYVIIHNNGFSSDSLQSMDLTGYTLYLDTLNRDISLTSETTFEPFETLIAYK